jgi:outer membrane immunogenic protein
MMKKLVYAASFLAISAVSASAQSAPNFGGTSAGVIGGYGWGHSNQTDPGPIPAPISNPDDDGDGHYSLNGGTLGGAAGYDRQDGRWVFGLLGDLSWADVAGQSAVCGSMTPVPHPCGTRLEALGTFRGRIGLAVGPAANWLIYGTGGLAIGDVHGWDSLTPASGNDWRAGWTLGAGVETPFAPNWTVKLEYLYVDLGKSQVFNFAPGIPESVSVTANLVRLGINYKFGDPAPAAAPRLYTKAPYLKAPALAGNPWAGWYIGLNAGYVDGTRGIGTDAFVTSTSSYIPTSTAMAAGATSRLSAGQGGFIGGAQAGYNYLLSPTVLAGIEADFQGSSLKGNAALSSVTPIAGAGAGSSFATTITASRSLDYLGTMRARLGATITPAVLLYATGGLAYGGVTSSTAIGQTAITGNPPPATATGGSFSDARVGYVVGAGGEWLLQSKWSAKIEYLHYDLGSANYGTGGVGNNVGPTSLPGNGIASIATTTHVRFDGDIVRFGINYHLN